MKDLFNLFIYEPIYNLLVWLTHVIPGEQLGLAIISLTLIIKFVLLPLSHKAIRAQKQMRLIQDEVKAIQDKYKDDKERLGREMLAVYKAHGVNPFSSILLMFIQIPILLAIFWVIKSGLPFNQDLVYSFVVVPTNVQSFFLGIDLTKGSVIMAILVAVSQYFQMHFAMPKTSVNMFKEGQTFQEQLAKSMQFNMRYVMPAIIGLLSLSLPAALALYWFVGNIFSICHELYVKKSAEEIVGKAEGKLV